MITDDITQFAQALPPLSPLIGLDLGTKTIGIAVSDTFLSVATPLETIKRKKFSIDAEVVIAIIKTRGIAGKCAGRLTSGAFAAVHIAGQAQHHARDPARFDDRNHRLGIY